MNTFSLAIRIWSRVIFINAITGGIALCVLDGTNIFVGFFFLLMAAIVFTSPLLMLITPLILIANRIPYEADAKIKWLSFMLILVAMGFYGLFVYFLGESIAHNKEFYFLVGGTTLSVVVGVRFSSKSLSALNAVA